MVRIESSRNCGAPGGTTVHPRIPVIRQELGRSFARNAIASFKPNTGLARRLARRRRRWRRDRLHEGRCQGVALRPLAEALRASGDCSTQRAVGGVGVTRLFRKDGKPRKPCRRCGGPKEAGPSRQLCDSCLSVPFRERTQQRKHERVSRLRKLYGITEEDYQEQLRIQIGECSICRHRPKTGEVLDVDHCHSTGRNRGLLCRRCNLGLSKFRDNPRIMRRAAQYLEYSWM